MESEQAWWLNAKCATLSPIEADDIFFGSRGSKPKKAEEFCWDCPTRRICLSEALQYKAQGFMCGTTENERLRMQGFIMESARKLSGLMPQEPDPTVRPIYLKVFSPPDHHDWMDEVEPPDALLDALDSVPPLDLVWDSIPISLAS